jgi:hypothetical protein
MDTCGMQVVKAEIYNNLIAGNFWAGLDFSGVGCKNWQIRASFNTVVGNGRGSNSFTGLIGPLYGFPSDVYVGQSLFANPLNTMGTQLQLFDKIELRDVVVSAADNVSLPGVTKADVELDASLSLKSTSTVNTNCCIDKAVAISSDKFPAFDRSGQVRPKGNGHDIGANEVK